MREYLSDAKSNDLMRGFCAYLDLTVEIPRVCNGEKSTIQTLISEEAGLLAKYLRDEKRE